MKKFKFELNQEGIGKLLKSPEMMAECNKYAEKAKNQLGEGYSISKYTGKTRVNVSVSAQSYKARKENAENNSLLKAVFSK